MKSMLTIINDLVDWSHSSSSNSVYFRLTENPRTHEVPMSLLLGHAILRTGSELFLFIVVIISIITDIVV